MQVSFILITTLSSRSYHAYCKHRKIKIPQASQLTEPRFKDRSVQLQKPVPTAQLSFPKEQPDHRNTLFVQQFQQESNSHLKPDCFSPTQSPKNFPEIIMNFNLNLHISFTRKKKKQTCYRYEGKVKLAYLYPSITCPK